MSDATVKQSRPPTGGERSELLAEHAALRAEILKRIEFRHQLGAISLAAAAAFLGAGVTVEGPTVAMILPLLIPFLALAWVQNDFRVGQIAAHIRKYVETRLKGISWETWLQQDRSNHSGRWHWRRTVLAQAGVFIVIQVGGMALGIWHPSGSSPASALVGLDSAAIVAVVITMGWALFRYHKTSLAGGGSGNEATNGDTSAGSWGAKGKDVDTVCGMFKAEELFEEPDEDEAIGRGFRSRFKLNTNGVSIHLADLTPGVQNGHKHESLFELIMLVDGAVVGICWEGGGRIDSFALREQGDAVLFHPKQAHTLVVERDSQVVVVRFAATDADPNERIPLDLPTALAAARNEFLSNPRSVAAAVLKGSSGDTVRNTE